MAYGRGGNKDRLKRMMRLGQAETSPALADLRLGCLDALPRLAAAVWPDDVLDPMPRDMDAAMTPVQSQLSRDGLNNVWAEKMRLDAKAAVREQWQRAQRTLFGKFRHVAAMTDPERLNLGQAPKLVNLPDGWTDRLSAADVAALQTLADGRDFNATLALFRELRAGDAGLPKLHAEALRAMADTIRLRFGPPEWRREDATVQLDLDYRCVRGGKAALQMAIAMIDEGLKERRPTKTTLLLAAHKPRGMAIPQPFRLVPGVAKSFASDRTDQRVSSLVLEIGPGRVEAKAVVTRLPTARPIVGHACVVAEDFGYRVTSSLAVVVSDAPIEQAAVDRVAGHNGCEDTKKIGKREAKAFLETHVAPAGVRTLETLQFDGTDFLDRISEQARRIDRLRSEIDLIYGRMGTIRAEMNRIAGTEPDAVVPETAPDGMDERWLRMHGRFFRLLAAVGKLKALRRAVYRSVDGLKRAWFGHVSSRKAELAEKHGAVVVREDLTVVTKPTDDPRYKGRTFNRMINNGSKGQYIRRSEDKLAWRGIPCIRIPSFHTSSTNTRVGKVDKRQRKQGGRAFVAALDGRRGDADVHASETIGRYLFLVPKQELKTAA